MSGVFAEKLRGYANVSYGQGAGMNGGDEDEDEDEDVPELVENFDDAANI